MRVDNKSESRYIKLFIIMLIKTLIIFGVEETKFSGSGDFRGVQLGDVVAILSEESGKNIIADEKVKDRVVDIYFKQGENLGRVLNFIAISNGLRLQKIDESSYIFRDGKGEGGSITGVVKLQGYHGGIDGVKVTLLNSGIGETYTEYGGKYVINDVLSGNYMIKFEKNGFFTEGELIYIDDKDKNKKIDIFLIKNKGGKFEKEIDEKGSRDIEEFRNNSSRVHVESDSKITERITLVNVSSDEVKKLLDSTLNSEVTVTSFPKLNLLLIKGGSNLVKIAIDIARDMDIHMKQVRIAAQTLEITDNLFENLGFSWVYQSGSLKELPQANPEPGSPEPNPPIAIDSGGNNVGILNSNFADGIGSTINIMRFFNNKNDFLNFSINLLQGTTDAVVSAIPSIIVLNGETGKFDITEETLVSYKTTNFRTGDDNQTNTEPITGTAGIILDVIPIIKSDNSIFLKINVEVSNFTGNSNTITAQGGYNPKVTRKLSTTVSVKDGDTIFIGGMKSTSSNNFSNQIPFLGDLPIIGVLFKNRGTANRLKDLYIKLKVDIVDSEEAKKELDYSEFKQINENKKTKKIFQF